VSSQLSSTSSRKSQPLLHPLFQLARSANGIVQTWRENDIQKEEQEKIRREEETKQILSLRLSAATKLEEWEDAARQLDVLEGHDAWKADSKSNDYNTSLIAKRLAELDRARINCDIPAMLHLVRTSLSRDLGGIGNIDLCRPYIGTKSLIERYVDATTSTIESLVEQSAIPGALPDDVEHRDLLDALLCARQSFGRSALLCSGGGTFGMTHIGVLKAMFEADLLPRIVSGASAGSIVVAVLCTRTDEEIPAVLKAFPHGALDVFEENGKEDTLAAHLKRLFMKGAWSDIRHLKRVMREVLGDMTFQEAYNRTRRICNICVSSASLYELPRLLNYITAPQVMIWSAVAASCSVPLIFKAAPLLAKDPATGEHIPWNPRGQGYIDGSVDNDLPMTRLAEMFNVNHFIISQVNPHIVPFLTKDDHVQTANETVEGVPDSGQGSSWLSTLSALAKDEALHRLHFLAELGIFPNLVTKLQSVLSQKYSGHINILPKIELLDLPRILRNPDADFMLRACLSGERATWPKLSRIRYRCATELALDRAVHLLRARVVFSRSQVDLRRLVTGSETSNLTALRPTIAQEGQDGLTSTELSIEDSLKSATGTELRQRRNSGSNLQIPDYHRRMAQQLQPTITDDETEEEERLELRLQRREKNMRLAQREIVNKAKRGVRSQFDLALGSGPMTSPLPAKAFLHDTGFDFSRPFISHSIKHTGSGKPASKEAGQNTARLASGTTEEPGPAVTQPSCGHTLLGGAEPPIVDATHAVVPGLGIDVGSPTEDTSNPDPYTWDADGDSHTEDSVSSEMDSLEMAPTMGSAKR
jgi:TAG lipase / steryl ester hydrolase / phospholipase A2 / LPA acyltransferase